MSENTPKTLKQVSDEAAANYAAYKEQEKIVGFDTHPDNPDYAYGSGLKEDVNIDLAAWQMAKESVARKNKERGIKQTQPLDEQVLESKKSKFLEAAGVLKAGQDKLKEIEAEGVRQYRENGAEMHDIAVLEAHLGGVAINVEQPVTVGQQVPVRVEHPSER